LLASHVRGGTKLTFATMSATLETYHNAHGRSRTLTVAHSGKSSRKLPAIFDQLPATVDEAAEPPADDLRGLS
jgi:hypothetical protein